MAAISTFSAAASLFSVSVPIAVTRVAISMMSPSAVVATGAFSVSHVDRVVVSQRIKVIAIVVAFKVSVVEENQAKLWRRLAFLFLQKFSTATS